MSQLHSTLVMKTVLPLLNETMGSQFVKIFILTIQILYKSRQQLVT